MENKRPKFEDTVDVLVKAYLNDTLAHGICTACAVGNIIASSIGATLVKPGFGEYGWYRNQNEIYAIWHEVFSTQEPGKQRLNLERYNGMYKKQIDASGYTLDELAKIEFAFESIDIEDDDELFNSDAHQYAGLMAVVDVLAEIHGVNLSDKEEAKKLFVKV